MWMADATSRLLSAMLAAWMALVSIFIVVRLYQIVPRVFDLVASLQTAAELSLRLFMRMFLPLEECHPLVCAVAFSQHHADEFPGLRAEIGGSGFKFLRGPGPFHAVL